MHPNAIHSRLSKQQAETEARLTARLDRLELLLSTIMKAAGLEVPAPLALEAPKANAGPMDVVPIVGKDIDADEPLDVEWDTPTETTTHDESEPAPSPPGVPAQDLPARRRPARVPAG